MTVTIKPSKAKGEIFAPPSKSMAHRALICGALSKNSIIRNIDFSADVKATLGALENLGANVDITDDGVIIGGLSLESVPNDAVIDCFESGSTIRFLLPFCMCCGKKVTIKGAKRLFERPLTIYEQIAKEQGILFEKGEQSLTVCGTLKSGTYKVLGNISSQFITGLLFTLPLLSNKSQIEIIGDFESESYIDLTLSVLDSFGVIVSRKDNTFYIEAKQKYNDCEYEVEGDCSNAAFLEAFNYLGGNVEVSGLKLDTLQGDRVYKQIFEGLKKGQKQFDLADCPDLAPVVFAISSVYGGAEFTGTKRLKIKESNRAEVMKTELSKFGIETVVLENSVIVKNGELKTPEECLQSHNDHRIVMALSLLLSITGGSIEGAEAVCKSYPNYFSDIKTIGIDVNEVN
ncbi:MAG: 3-phosphoshikimate 1-carboxyvinyltransferase [Ruminococcaceae bacterium]|nr:3-phosphoshikimate 1-carboxyvinyltransferase [Oscillospiraceae bacterium]